jgi:hypothetical protein
MSRTYDNEKKPSQSTFSFKPTASFLQTRGFAPIQTDLDEDATPRPSGYTENFLEKIINQRGASGTSDTPVQPKRMNRLQTLQAKRMSMIQAKLSIGEPNDKYEQEADATASKVVQQINSPIQDQSVQREASMEEEEELQMKPISSIQREAAMEEEEELQMKPISSIQREAAMEEEEELQMKSLVQRRENLGGGEASTDLESSIQSARGSGQSLDPNLQAKMGQAMGADFSGVKVHTDSQSDQLNKSIQSKAFTTGQDVFFRQGAYEPSSRGGQELIAHELTHVVQQNGGTTMPIQRLPTLNSFKASTKIDWSIRWKVSTLDDLIRDFHALPLDDYAQRVVYINQIVQACQNYIGLPNQKAKRKVGVQTLLNNANQERPIYLALEQMANAGNLRDKYNEAVNAQDLALQQENAGNNTLSATSSSIGAVIRTILTNINTNEPATMDLLAQDDLQRLQDMLRDPLLPQITQDVINELIGDIGEVGLVGTQGGPGARLANPTDNLGTKKYKVAHGLDQKMGTSERLGSLVHELTHVASGESYDNTSSFLMFATTLTPVQIQQLGATRVNEVTALKNLCTNDVALNDRQKELLQEKIAYGFEDKLPLYAARFQDAGIQARNDANKLLAVDPHSVIGQTKRAKADTYDADRQIMMTAAAAAPGQSSVFIEYETVMNQMLIYMYQWGIPNNNPFYTKLRQVAQDAYDARDAARP